jgi:hypothetical protein
LEVCIGYLIDSVVVYRIDQTANSWYPSVSVSEHYIHWPVLSSLLDIFVIDKGTRLSVNFT